MASLDLAPDSFSTSSSTCWSREPFLRSLAEERWRILAASISVATAFIFMEVRVWIKGYSGVCVVGEVEMGETALRYLRKVDFRWETVRVVRS